MLVTRNTQKTVTIEMQPGERFDIDNQGFSVASMILRWAGNVALKEALASAVNEMKKYQNGDDELSAQMHIDARSRKEEIIHEMFETLPAYRIKRVWTGFNY